MRDKGWKWAQATVWNIEKGERPLRLAEAEALAEILGVSLDRILEAPDVLGHEQQLQIWIRDIDSSYLKVADLTEELLGQLELLGYTIDDLPQDMDASNYWVDLAVKAAAKTPEQAVLRGRAEREIHARSLNAASMIAEFGSREAWYRSISTSPKDTQNGEHPEA